MLVKGGPDGLSNLKQYPKIFRCLRTLYRFQLYHYNSVQLQYGLDNAMYSTDYIHKVDTLYDDYLIELTND